MSADPQRARWAFNSCVSYLKDRGWHRDGDDPGVWVLPESSGELGPREYSFGDALTTQLIADGVSMEEQP